MATRFYLTTGSSVSSPPTTLKGTWNTTSPTTITIPAPLSTAKGGSVIDGRTVSEGAAANPNAVLLVCAVSQPLPAQTISGTINVTLGVKASVSTARYYWRMHVYVTVGSTDAVRGTLLSNYSEDVSHWTVAGQGEQFVANVAVNPVIVQAGDRIVAEIGYIARTVLQLGRGSGTGGDVASDTSQISSTFSTPPAVGSGIVVMMSGQKDSAGMTFGTCTDNRGNTYQVALPQRRIATVGEYAIIIYFCPKVLVTGNPFIITVTGDGNDHCFEGCAVEVIGLGGGSLAVAGFNSNPTSGSAVSTGPTANITGEVFLAALFARTISTPSIVVESASPQWLPEYRELVDSWLQTIVGGGDTRTVTLAGTPATAQWTTGNSGPYVAGIAAFRVVGAVVEAFPSGNGTIYVGAPVGSVDLTDNDPQITIHAGSISFSNDLLGSPSLVGHVVSQVARAASASPSLVGHVVQQIARVPPPSAAVLSHVIVQTIPTIAPALADLSGLYFLNPGKPTFHDSYYNSTELKIPDPTIKSAFLGE